LLEHYETLSNRLATPKRSEQGYINRYALIEKKKWWHVDVRHHGDRRR
jgi:hypothetical protein